MGKGDVVFNSGVNRNYRKKLMCDPSERRTKTDPTTDIHHIVGQYLKTGVLPVVREPIQQTGNEPVDLMEALNTVSTAQSIFSQLPANMRFEMFQNDFRKFWEYQADPDNVEKLFKMGVYRHSDEYLARKKAEELAAATAAGAKPAKSAPSPKVGKKAPPVAEPEED